MFRFLTRLFNGHLKKETEIKRLKLEIEVGKAQCQDAAEKGDPKAKQTLRELDKVVSEQSIRLLRQNAKPHHP